MTVQMREGHPSGIALNVGSIAVRDDTPRQNAWGAFIANFIRFGAPDWFIRDTRTCRKCGTDISERDLHCSLCAECSDWGNLV